MHPLLQRHKLALPCVSFPLAGLASTWGTPEQGCQNPRTWNTSVACSLAQPHLGHTSHLKQYTHTHTHTCVHILSHLQSQSMNVTIRAWALRRLVSAGQRSFIQ